MAAVAASERVLPLAVTHAVDTTNNMGSMLSACLVLGMTLRTAAPTAPPDTASSAGMGQRALWAATLLERRVKSGSINLRRHALQRATSMLERWVHGAAPKGALSLSRFANTKTGSPRVRAVVLPLAPVLAVGTLMTLAAAQHGALDPVMAHATSVQNWLALLGSREPEE